MNEAPLIGSTLGDRYRLLEVIGDGGMGCVFRAEQLATGQPVAVKLLHPEFATVDEVLRRFEREAKVTTQLSHPHIVKVIDCGEWNRRPYLAMELLPGRSLADLIERGDGKSGRRLTVKRTLAIMRPVLDALEYAHGRGVVHRDLKPENIMVVPGRGLLARESVKLLDFGIAKLGHRSAGATQKLTRHGLILGTPRYMSPEQAAGQDADLRSDLYSCGVILYQLLTGRPPFEAESGVDVIVMHLNATPRALGVAAPGASIPRAVDEVVLRALAKRPGDRFQSARALRDAFERAAKARFRGVTVSGVAATALATPRPPPPTRSRLIHLAIITAALALLLGHHLRPRPPGAGHRVAAAETADTPRKTRAVEVPETPATPRVKKARPLLKKPTVRKRQP